jgi:hypothetical protein
MRKARPAAIDHYTLDVRLVSGPVSETFARNNAVVARTIQLRADQTLADLHQAIFEAFGRMQDQMYEFQIGPRPNEPEVRRYVLPAALDMAAEGMAAPTGTVTDTTLACLGLEVGDRFSYWFDFAADWWHQVRVKKIDHKPGRGSYPRIAARVGDNPPQQPPEDLHHDSDPRVISGDEAADVSCLIGEMHLSKGDYTKAVEAFSRAIDHKPTPDAFYGRARAYRSLAIQDERRVLDLVD